MFNIETDTEKETKVEKTAKTAKTAENGLHDNVCLFEIAFLESAWKIVAKKIINLT